MEHPNDPQLIEYLEVVNAKTKLVHGQNDIGELELSNLLRRSPKNVHALFLLGSHLFWVEKDTQRPIRLLEQCHRHHPNFLRANACLAALYKKLAMETQASHMFRLCARLETDKTMKEFFLSLS